MCAKIEQAQKGENYFICVSPKFWDDGIHPRNERQITFMNYFERNNTFIKIQDRISDIPNPSNLARPYKRFERVFKLTM